MVGKNLKPNYQWSERIYIRVKREDIAILRFLVESYDNLAYMTVLDKYEAIVQLIFSPDQKEEMLELIDGLKQEIDLYVFDIKS